jgi:polyisoprenoid-binding protein YceI
MKKGLFLGVTIASALILTTAEAQTRYNSQPGKSTVKVSGVSTLHDWVMESGVVGGFIELGSGVEIDQAKGSIAGLQDGKMPAKVRANINVTTLHSKAEHLPEVMDHLMQEHMKMEQYPSILFQATTLTMTNATPGKPFEFSATGDLTISGVTNSVTFPVTIEQPDPAHLHVVGTANLKMTDFKVEPPAPKVAGLGTLKCDDAITISIDWTVQKRAAQ